MGTPAVPAMPRLSPVETVAYHLLKWFSHSRNRLTQPEISAHAAQRALDFETPRWFLDFANPYVDYRGQTVLDIGSGYGDLCIWLAKTGAAQVTGVEIDSVRTESARRQAAQEGLSAQVEFVCVDFVADFRPVSAYDLILSLDAFEHVVEIERCLQKAYHCLRPGGSLVTLFGPLWLSPYGAHMWGFTPVPWVHLLFPESVVMRLRRERYRPDEPADRYESIIGHLSRMTVERFHRSAVEAGFAIRVLRVNPDKDRRWGGWLRPFNALINRQPILREFGAQLLLAVLTRSG
jgi:SAM-dependent methyltransferase